MIQNLMVFREITGQMNIHARFVNPVLESNNLIFQALHDFPGQHLVVRIAHEDKEKCGNDKIIAVQPLMDTMKRLFHVVRSPGHLVSVSGQFQLGQFHVHAFETSPQCFRNKGIGMLTVYQMTQIGH